MSWRPSSRTSSTSLQNAVVHFKTAVDQARLTLTEEQFEALVSILTSWVAHEHRRQLERDDLRRRRAA